MCESLQFPDMAGRRIADPIREWVLEVTREFAVHASEVRPEVGLQPVLAFLLRYDLHGSLFNGTGIEFARRNECLPAEAWTTNVNASSHTPAHSLRALSRPPCRAVSRTAAA